MRRPPGRSAGRAALPFWPGRRLGAAQAGAAAACGKECRGPAGLDAAPPGIARPPAGLAACAALFARQGIKTGRRSFAPPSERGRVICLPYGTGVPVGTVDSAVMYSAKV